ncbi:hypothetical protein [Cerasicoccus frondis]|uniref:hypothetical protein n=1 Tax=Cerasicoccus frondis TaxID=490090 RepID=UPI0028526F4A|nr:hypothetical protein [Cerasicoccus frondis]
MNKFELSVFARIFAIFVFILTPVFGYLRLDSGNPSYMVGAIIGSLVAVILIPYCIGWVVWRISGRKQNAGSMVFVVIMFLFFMGQVVNSFREMRDRQRDEVFVADM